MELFGSPIERGATDGWDRAHSDGALDELPRAAEQPPYFRGGGCLYIWVPATRPMESYMTRQAFVQLCKTDFSHCTNERVAGEGSAEITGMPRGRRGHYAEDQHKRGKASERGNIFTISRTLDRAGPYLGPLTGLQAENIALHDCIAPFFPLYNLIVLGEGKEERESERRINETE